MRDLGIVALCAAQRLLARSTVILPLVLAACATQPQTLWLKPGAASEDFGQDRYACLQQSQQQSSSAYIDRYGGVANSGAITNGGLYDACMNSKGWVLTPVTDVKGFNETMRPIGEDLRANCSREDLQVLYRRKMACKAFDATPEQIGDRSKISNEEKIALAKWLDVVLANNDKIAATYRKFDSKNGDAVASTIETGMGDTRKLALELSNGSIPWGEYNRRRVELGKRLQESQKIALTY
jgi:hypothetical protein